MSKEKLIIIFTVFIDVIGLGIIIPIMPAYVQSFGVSAFDVTLLFSVFALCSFFSTPILGALSDKYGRRPILMISILSTSIGWFVFSSATSWIWLFVGRIIDGLAAGNFSTAQSAIADLSSNPKERTANLGMTGAIFGIGFLIGPLIGGILSKVSHSFPFLCVAVLALINFILAFFFLPETNKNLDHDKKIAFNPIKPIAAAVNDKKLRQLYMIWFLFNATAVGSNSVFALYLMNQFGFGSYETGIFFTLVGLVVVFNQGFALRKFWLKKFNEKQLIEMMFVAFAVGFFIMTYPSFGTFVLGVVFTAFGQSVLRVAITSEIMGEADVKERGLASGVLSSIMSMAAVIAPIMAGFLFEIKHFIPFVFSAVLSVLAIIIIYKRKFPKITIPPGVQ